MGLSIKNYRYSYGMLFRLRQDISMYLLGVDYACKETMSMGLWDTKEGCDCLCCNSETSPYGLFFFHSDCEEGFISFKSKQKHRKEYKNYDSLEDLKAEVSYINSELNAGSFKAFRDINHHGAWMDFRDDVLSANKLLHFG